jgi:hypothetical protein
MFSKGTPGVQELEKDKKSPVLGPFSTKNFICFDTSAGAPKGSSLVTDTPACMTMLFLSFARKLHIFI